MDFKDTDKIILLAELDYTLNLAVSGLGVNLTVG